MTRWQYSSANWGHFEKNEIKETSQAQTDGCRRDLCDQHRMNHTPQPLKKHGAVHVTAPM